MLLEVSVGEALDKYSILEIKTEYIVNQQKRSAILKELESLQECQSHIDAYPFLYASLRDTNKVIWKLTDRVKAMTEINAEYAQVAHSIFEENQKRFRIKYMLNHFASSTLHEQKSYAELNVGVRVTNLNIAVPLLWQLSFEYDKVYVSGDYNNILKAMFRTPNFEFIPTKDSIPDTLFHAKDTEKNNPHPIRYASGGRLGDFIHQLSVVFEKYLKTGRRGIIYMGENNMGGDIFARGVQTTLLDIAPLIGSLPYVHSLEIYSGQSYDINLNSWRGTPDLYAKSWPEIFRENYQVEWAKHPWITSPIRDDLANVTLVCTTPSRFPSGIRWDEFIKTLPGNVMFLRITQEDYEHFRSTTGVDLPCLPAISFTEAVVAIHSCLKFVGTLSMPLTIADALKKDRIALTQMGSLDERIATKEDSRYLNHF